MTRIIQPYRRENKQGRRKPTQQRRRQKWNYYYYSSLYSHKFPAISRLVAVALIVVVVVTTRFLLLTNDADLASQQTQVTSLDVATTHHNKNNSNNNNMHDAILLQMPDWMDKYFVWHRQQRRELTVANWKDYKYLMMQCLPGSKKCGGTADRLKPLPMVLRLAYQSQRILMIKWGRPAELEAYLVPPKNGMDWRVPAWLWNQKEFRQGPRATNLEELMNLILWTNNSNHHPNNDDFPRMVKPRVQSHDHGMTLYNIQRERISNEKYEPTFQEVYHLCWRKVFTPSVPVAKIIQQQLRTTGLIPGQYVGIHVRALYAVTERDAATISAWSRNAVNCASQLVPGGPYYMSSDSNHAISVAKIYGHEKSVMVAARSSIPTHHNNNDSLVLQQPLHLDKTTHSARTLPSDFYDTFVDLYFLAMSRCVTYNMGGFGTWALLISPYANRNDSNNNNNNKSNTSAGACSLQHHEASGMHKCDWVNRADGIDRNTGISSADVPEKQTKITDGWTKVMYDPPMVP